MASEALRKFAEELKSIREEKKITLQQISSRTKIDIKFLRKIEESDFHVLPDLYIRAFLKEYLKNLEVDVEKYMKKFDLAKQGLNSDTPAETPHQISQSSKQDTFSDIDESSNNHSGLLDSHTVSKAPADKIYYYLGAVGFCILLVVFIYFVFIRESSPEIVAETPYEEYIEESKERFEIEKEKQIEQFANDSLNLSIATLGRVWIKVTSDSKVIQEGMVPENQKLSFRAGEEFRVVVGSAGLANISLNNKSIGPLGNIGEIKNIIITEDTIRSYTLTVPSRNEQRSE